MQGLWFILREGRGIVRLWMWAGDSHVRGSRYFSVVSLELRVPPPATRRQLWLAHFVSLAVIYLCTVFSLFPVKTNVA